VTGILPSRLVTRQKLLTGSLVVMAVSVLQLIGFDLWIFGSPWPIALLWAACGWAGLGPNMATAGLLFALGIWVDVLTGSVVGTWAFIALLTHGVTLLSARFFGTGALSPLVNCALGGIVMICIIAVFSFWQHKGIDLFGALTPILSSIAFYFLVSSWFELSEDET
jgi:hypothetical protein